MFIIQLYRISACNWFRLFISSCQVHVHKGIWIWDEKVKQSGQLYDPKCKADSEKVQRERGEKKKNEWMREKIECAEDYRESLRDSI